MPVQRFTWLAAGVTALALGTSGAAVAEPIGPEGFTNPVAIDFNAAPVNTFLGPGLPNPFAGQGVVFTGFTLTTSYPAPFSGNMLVASITGPVPLPGAIRADFLPSAGPVFRAGADVVPGFAVAPTITAYDAAGAVIETLAAPPSTTFPQPYFLGLQTTTPIARVEFSQSPFSANTFPNLDNFRFEGEGPTAVPEPSGLALLALGTLGLGLLGCRRRRQAA